jgi:hypothetical protein
MVTELHQVSFDLMAALEEQLKEDLTLTRFINEQVLEEIASRYEYSGNRLGEFFQERYLTLEDYQADLVFSPLFTPGWEDKLRYAQLVGFSIVTEQDVKALIGRLESQGLNASFQTQTGETWLTPVHEVNLERYVTKLMLEQPISDNLAEKIKAYVPNEHHYSVALLARDAVWEGPQREALLTDYLQVFHAKNEFTLDKVRYLTDFVRTYRPTSHADLVRQFESMIKSCESDLNNVADQSFYDQQFKELYSDSERAHFKNIDVQHRYQYFMTMAEQLLEAQNELLRLRS